MRVDIHDTLLCFAERIPRASCCIFISPCASWHARGCAGYLPVANT